MLELEMIGVSTLSEANREFQKALIDQKVHFILVNFCYRVIQTWVGCGFKIKSYRL